MRKFILLVLTTICLSFTTFAQSNCITFLGIPVNGTKTEMISKLESKGFTYILYNNCLVGEFNGVKVLIAVQTVNNKVWRIGIVDGSAIDETNIKIRFNNLFEQFSNNGKYELFSGSTLSEQENIQYEIDIRNKRYDATFIPKDKSINGSVWYTIAKVNTDKYVITMFYENLNNAADGSDL